MENPGLSAMAMTQAKADDAFALIDTFLSTDTHYLDSSPAYGGGGADAVRKALALFVSRPELGFVWLAYESGTAVACCVACYAISTTAGGIVVKLDDVTVLPGREGQGIGTFLLTSLKAELRRRSVKRIDTSCHHDNSRAYAFYERQGFRPVREERLTQVL
jgi:GNAT superfamily N-acetyltransferase